jgi:hypothetical protein
MSRLSRNPLRFIAEQKGWSLRKTQRMAKAGKFPFLHQTPGGHYRLRPLSEKDKKTVIEIYIMLLLERFKGALLPNLDEVIEFTLAEARLTNDTAVLKKFQSKAEFEFDPRKFKALSQLMDDPNRKLVVKATVLRSRGKEVTRENLAKAMGVPIRTLRDPAKFDQGVVHQLCDFIPARDEAFDEVLEEMFASSKRTRKRKRQKNGN